MPGLNTPGALQIIDPVLSSIARNYKPTTEGYVGDLLLPGIPTNTLSAQYPVFDEAFWFGTATDAKSDDRSPSKEVNFSWSTESYLCEEYKLKTTISDLEAAQAHAALNLRRQKAAFLASQMAHAREIRAAALLTTSDAGGGGLDASMDAAPSVNWDQATATIESDIKTAVLAVYDQIGRTPNTIVIPFKVAYEMALQEDIRNIIRYDATGKPRDFIEVGSRVLPAVIHDMKVVIPKAQKNTAAEGATKSISEIWGDDVRLLYVDPDAQWGMPSVAYRFVHTQPTVTRWRTTDPDIEHVRELERVDEKVVAPFAGYLLTDTLS